MADPRDPRSPALAGAEIRRLELKSALSAVEVAAASPSGAPGWRARLVAALVDLASALDTHVEEVERADGLLAELIEAEPRLTHRVDRLRDEHPPLQAQVGSALDQAQSDDTGSDALRAQVVEVLIAIVRHRQSGADVVFEVYNLDIGGG